MSGDYCFINHKDFEKLISHSLGKDSNTYKKLISKHIIYENADSLNTSMDLLANQIRTKQIYLKDFTSLHMIEVTSYCNLSCEYCQASTKSIEVDCKNQTRDRVKQNVIWEQIIHTIFKSPSKDIKVELQGGEPLVDWESCKYIVEKTTEVGKEYPNKHIEIIICTNLLLIDEEKLDFIKKYNVQLSTSLDGPIGLHDAHRKHASGKPSYLRFLEKLDLSRKILGHDAVGALLTVTRTNLYKLKEVIDEYERLNFGGLFIRALNPYGMAVENVNSLSYSAQEFVNQYVDALEYICQLNNEGKIFIDYYTSLLFNRINTPFSTGFMDLQNPAGAGISGAMYDYNGNVYPTDEGRMLARMGNEEFKLGNVLQNSYEEIFANEKLLKITRESVLQTIPSCSSCVYNVYCGSDPIRNYVESGNIIGHKPTSEHCYKNTALFNKLFEMHYKNDEKYLDVYWAWTTKRSLGEVRV